MEGVLIRDGQLGAALAVHLAARRLVTIAHELASGVILLAGLIDGKLAPRGEIRRERRVGNQLGGIGVIVGLECEGVEERRRDVARAADVLEGLHQVGDLALVGGRIGLVGLGEDNRRRRGYVLAGDP